MDILRKDGKFSKRYSLPVYKKVNKGVEHRRYIRPKSGKILPLARYIWNLTYPSNMIRQGEEIHHKDFNPMNDDIGNLVKLTSTQHKVIHELHCKKDNVISFNIASVLRDAIESRKIRHHIIPDIDSSEISVWTGHQISQTG